MKIKKISENKYQFFCPVCGVLHTFGNEVGFDNNYENPTFENEYITEGFIMKIKENIAPFRCHSIITNGMIEYLSECNHNFKGKILEMKEI